MSTPTFGLAADHPILAALQKENGAQFYRCALQVNPFQYLVDQGKVPPGVTIEEEYNAQLVAALVAHEVQVIAITDHWRAHTAAGLQAAATAAGITVFPGFEASTHQGTHVLCLFNPKKALAEIDGYVGVIFGTASPINPKADARIDVPELVDKIQNQWGGICLAPHIITDHGLLHNVTTDQQRIDYRCPELWAACIPGIRDSLKQNHPEKYNILDRTDTYHYERKRKLALLNAGDVNGPADVTAPCSTTHIKLAALTIKGLRQAFLDPSSRIWLNGEPEPEDHLTLQVAAWQGGPLDGLTLRWNDNLNVVIGGRGTGKSSVLETIRYALGAKSLGEEAGKAHTSVVEAMLKKSSGQVSIVVRGVKPTPHYYLIQRRFPGSPQVIDADGVLLALSPREALGTLPEVYGQHEIAELAKDPFKRTALLTRFLPDQTQPAHQKTALRTRLTATRKRLLAIEDELATAQAHLDRLPALREKLNRYKAAGLEDKLRIQTQWNSEGRLFKVADQQLAPLDEMLAQLRQALPLDREAVRPAALAGSPNTVLLQDLATALTAVETTARALADQLATALGAARRRIVATEATWKPLRTAVDSAFQAMQQQLQAAGIDAADYLSTQRQLENLLPFEKQQQSLLTERAALQQNRRQLLLEWETTLATEQAALVKAAQLATGRLKGGVRVQVVHQAGREELRELVRRALAANSPGPHEPILLALEAVEALSLRDLSAACQAKSTAALRQAYPTLTEAQAGRLVNISAAACLEAEELELTSSTTMELNVAEPGEPTDWRQLENLSVGQKATAVLRLLLLPSAAPLLIDQPEDDLDNRFIADAIVPTIKEEKLRRQFIFATHNANIPVLGDADLIVGLQLQRSDDQDKISRKTEGALETPDVHVLVEKVLEGGKAAFETRRTKYNY